MANPEIGDQTVSFKLNVTGEYCAPFLTSTFTESLFADSLPPYTAVTL